jgi:hypothetical protein
MTPAKGTFLILEDQADGFLKRGFMLLQQVVRISHDDTVRVRMKA